MRDKNNGYSLGSVPATATTATTPCGTADDEGSPFLSSPQDVKLMGLTNQQQQQQSRQQYFFDSTTIDVKSKTATMDEAIRLTGSGPFHWLLSVATGMCSACAVFQLILPSYLLSSASCELGMDTADKSLLSAISFVGMVLGTHMWGVLADSWGRVPLLRLALLLDALVGVVSCVMPDKRLFIAARFFNGFFVGAPTSSAMAYLGEFHSEDTRAKALVIFGIFPGASTLVAAGLAYSVLPLDLPFEAFRSWRLFVLIFAMPSLLTALSLFWFPESPRFLLSTGRSEQALAALQKAYSVNKRRPREDFPVSALVDPSDGKREGGGAKRSCAGKLLAVWNQTVPLFRGDFLRNTLLMCAALFANVFSANGFLVWMPEIFNRMSIFLDVQPGVSATACDAITYLVDHPPQSTLARSAAMAVNSNHSVTGMARSMSLVRLASDGGQDACRVVLQDAMFINTAIIGVANVVIGILGVFIVNWVGKRNMLVVILMLSGVFGILLNFVNSSTALLGLACGLIGLTSTGISVSVSVAVENYPTVLRATAVSLGMLAGRLGSMSGSFFFGMMLETQCSSAFYTLGGLLIGCGFLSILLPKRGVYAS